MMKTFLTQFMGNGKRLFFQQRRHSFPLSATGHNNNDVHYSFSTSSSSSSSSSLPPSLQLSRYGLGGQNWKKFNPKSYQQLIQEALLQNHVDYFEISGPEGGEIALVGAIQSVLLEEQHNPSTSILTNVPITITTRLGYRSVNKEELSLPEESEGNGGNNNNHGASSSLSTRLRPGDVVLAEAPSTKKTSYDTPSNVVHNLSPDYILETIQKSPLLELQQDMKQLQLVFLLHNPEVQVVELLKEDPQATLETRMQYIQQQWTPAMELLEEYSASTASSNNNAMISFGIVSNGLGIPPEQNHPMVLDVDIVLDAIQKYTHFTTVQLPANLLETYGWEVARKIQQQHYQSSSSSSTNHQKKVTVTVMRPLTCYPCLGTSDMFPFRLVDYALPCLDSEIHDNKDNDDDNEDAEDAVAEDKKNPSSAIISSLVSTDLGFIPRPSFHTGEDQETTTTTTDHDKKKIMKVQYTNDMSGIPAIYQMTLQAAMSHFDAEHLLEIKQERDLTMEERETLDGCKLMQSMIHDLDNALVHIRSFAAHEEELYEKIIPLMYDTFEVMDEKTSNILQAYFAAYAVAVRYAIAKKTRELLKGGSEQEENNKDTKWKVTYPTVPDGMTLQEFALRNLLAEPAFDRIVMGASTLQDFHHQMELMKTLGSDPNPLDAIEVMHANEQKEEEMEKDIQAKEKANGQ